MNNLIEQAKKAVQERLAVIHAGQGDAISNMIFNGLVTHPGSNTLDYWNGALQGFGGEPILDTTKEKTAATSAAQEPAAAVTGAREGRTTDGFIWKQDFDTEGKTIKIMDYEGSNKDITIPAEIDGRPVTVIEAESFKGKDITSVIIPASINAINYRAFEETKITSVIIPGNVKVIESDSFRNTGLTSLTLGNGIEKIEREAFADNNLTSLTIPDSIIEIDKETFINNQITELNLGKGLKKINRKAFENNKLTNVTIPGNVTEIGEKAFINNQITELNLEEGIQIIEYEAFSKNKLTKVTIPESMVTLGSEVFINNPLEVAVLLNGNTKFSGKTFGKATVEKLAAFAADRRKYPIAEDFRWDKTKDGKGIRLWTYRGIQSDDKDRKMDEVHLPSQIEGLPVIELFSVFDKTVEKINTLVIPDSVISITGTVCAKECGLEKLVLGKGLKHIGNGAFGSCKLTELVLPDGLESIGSSAFSSNELTEVKIPDSVTHIGEGAFQQNKIKSVTIPKGLTYVPSGIFVHNHLTSVTLHDGIFAIEESAFGSNRLTKITLPKHLKYIGYKAFQTNRLKSLTIPDSVTAIGDNAFEFNSLTEINFGKGLVRIEGYTFEDNKKLAEAVIPYNIVYIESRAFDDSANLIRPDGTKFKGIANVESRKITTFPPRTDYIRKIDDTLNTGIAPKADELRTETSNMDPKKENVIAKYKEKFYVVKEITPAGNWLWELEAESAEDIVTIIAWGNKANADKAEEVYKSRLELIYRRWGNTTAYFRSTIKTSGSLSAFSDARPGG